ncbi:MAG: glycosyltransferase family 2 protein [Microgenomates group bacterium]
MQSKNKAKISICIPTYNRADLLAQTLQSVANQTIKPYEVIVVDNNSTDGTLKVCKHYQKKYGIKFIVNKKNIGMIGNWNNAISLAKGDYICLLHSDDLIAPDWHATWIKTISKHKAAFYTSAITIIDDKNAPLFTAHIFNHDRYMKQPETMKLFLQQLAPMIAPSGASIYQKKVFREIGLYDPAYKTEADVPHFLKLVSRYDVFYRDKIVFAWRTHEAQTFDKAKTVKSVEGELIRLDNYFKIIAGYYQSFYKNNLEWKIFVQTHMFMALSAINLHLIKGKLKKVVGSHRLARRHFPTALTTTSDWMRFINIQFKLVIRALTLSFINKRDKNSLSWLKDINIPKKL